MNKLSYQKPVLTTTGTVADLTRASFTNNQRDSIFFAGTPVATATGSMDACVSLNPKDPNGTCYFK